MAFERQVVLDQFFHGFEGGGVIGFMGYFGHHLAVGQGSVGADHKNGAGQQIQFLDQNAVGFGKGGRAVVRKGFNSCYASSAALAGLGKGQVAAYRHNAYLV